MSKKLFVGNLKWETTEDDLKALFESFGAIEDAVIIKDKFSGRSRGFGFVTLADDNAAADAISKLNGSDFKGRKLIVNEERPREERAPRRQAA